MAESFLTMVVVMDGIEVREFASLYMCLRVDGICVGEVESRV